MLLNEYKKAKEQEVSRYTELQICSAGAQGANPYPAIQVTAVTAQAVPRLVTMDSIFVYAKLTYKSVNEDCGCYYLLSILKGHLKVGFNLEIIRHNYKRNVMICSVN